MRIKSYKLFLESLNQSLYLSDEDIFHSYFIAFYDEYYECKIEKGWIDDKNQFRIMSPRKNVKLAYNIKLINKKKSNKKDTD